MSVPDESAVGSASAETVPVNSSVAPLATIAVTFAPTLGVLVLPRLKFNVPPFTAIALPVLSVVEPVSVSFLVLVAESASVPPVPVVPSVRLPLSASSVPCVTVNVLLAATLTLPDPLSVPMFSLPPRLTAALATSAPVPSALSTLAPVRSVPLLTVVRPL